MGIYLSCSAPLRGVFQPYYPLFLEDDKTLSHHEQVLGRAVGSAVSMSQLIIRVSAISLTIQSSFRPISAVARTPSFGPQFEASPGPLIDGEKPFHSNNHLA